MTALPAQPLEHSVPQLRPRLAYIDALRAIAALYVVLHHVFTSLYGSSDAHFGHSILATVFSPFLYGRAGVDLFLCISGFVLFYPIASGKREREPYGRFMARRAWRIVPPYYAALLLSVLLAPAGFSWGALIAHLLLIHNLSAGSHLYAINAPLWSIPLEFQLYACFPFIAFLWLRHRAWVPMGIAVLFTLASRFGLAKLGHLFAICNLWINSVPGFLAVFTFGMLAAHLSAKQWQSGRVHAFWLAGATAMLGGVALWHLQAQGFFLLGDTLWGLGSACFLLAFRTKGTWLRWPALAGIGRFSYSLYLIHAPLLGLMFVALGKLPMSLAERFGILLGVGVPIIVALAYGFHLLAERPFLGYPPFLKRQVP